ncbi:MAG: DUF1835 domain-containing protein [Sphingobacteriales bacterium]|nr:MAG: DUF1835 domain-containing protein [Sphingobacteriales bacterium]
MLRLFLQLMIYHFVVGDFAGEPLREAVSAEASMQGEVVVLRDILHVGPLRKEEGQSFSELRSAFWNTLLPGEKTPIVVDDMEKLLEVSAAMYKDENVVAWVWMAPAAADLCAYFWVLPYLSKHKGRFYVVNIAGLPFLDSDGKVHYPKNISQILPKELVKARRLARQVTPAEIEMDGDEWQRILMEDAGVRLHEGGKKITSASADYYDSQLLGFCTQQFQKASKVIRQTLSKFSTPTGDVFLAWRLREMIREGRLQVQGDPAKAPNEFDVKLPGDAAPEHQGSTEIQDEK